MRRRNGYTIMELVLVISIGTILLWIAIAAFSDLQQRTSLNQSRSIVWAMHARARAQAIESGQVVQFKLFGPADSIAITRNDSILEAFAFEEELGIDLYVSGDSARVCLTPSGVASLSCNSFTSLRSARLQATTGQTFYFWLFPSGGLLEQSS